MHFKYTQYNKLFDFRALTISVLCYDITMLTVWCMVNFISDTTWLLMKTRRYSYGSAISCLRYTSEIQTLKRQKKEKCVFHESVDQISFHYYSTSSTMNQYAEMEKCCENNLFFKTNSTVNRNANWIYSTNWVQQKVWLNLYICNW